MDRQEALERIALSMESIARDFNAMKRMANGDDVPSKEEEDAALLSGETVAEYQIPPGTERRKLEEAPRAPGEFLQSLTRRNDDGTGSANA